MGWGRGWGASGDLCLSFVLLSQIEADSRVQYPVMEQQANRKGKRRRASNVFFFFVCVCAEAALRYVRKTFPPSSYFMSYDALIS